MTRPIRPFVCLFALLLFGCADLRTYTTLEHPVDTPLTVSVGEQVWRVSKTRSLPNAFGKADVFGRTTAAGFSELRFLGMQGDSIVLLGFRDVDIYSNETTMSRGAFATFQQVGHTTIGTVVGGGGADAEVLPPYEAILSHDLNRGTTVRHSGITLTIMTAEPHQLTYSLRR